jgi:hypothetical protein
MNADHAPFVHDLTKEAVLGSISIGSAAGHRFNFYAVSAHERIGRLVERSILTSHLRGGQRNLKRGREAQTKVCTTLQ